MVIYEVKLNIRPEIYQDFINWLKEHIDEMLALPGFIQASLLKPEGGANSETKALTVQYQLENMSDLDRYFVEFAPKMRDEGIKRFQDQFSAERNVFHVEGIIKN